MSITITNIVTVPLNVAIEDFKFDTTTPAVTRIERVTEEGVYSYKVIAVAYVPQNLGNPIPVSKFNEVYYYIDEKGNKTPFEGVNSVSVNNADDVTNLAIVCFHDIKAEGAQTRGFALSYVPPKKQKGQNIIYNAISVVFNYTLDGGAQDPYNVFFTQADEDPRLSRGGISEGARPDK